MESRRQAEAAQARSTQAASESSIQALRVQFRAYQAAKAEEVHALEARLRRTLGITTLDRRTMRRCVRVLQLSGLLPTCNPGKLLCDALMLTEPKWEDDTAHAF